MRCSGSTLLCFTNWKTSVSAEQVHHVDVKGDWLAFELKCDKDDIWIAKYFRDNKTICYIYWKLCIRYWIDQL